jgi:hypothetical protein
MTARFLTIEYRVREVPVLTEAVWTARQPPQRGEIVVLHGTTYVVRETRQETTTLIVEVELHDAL